MFLTGSGGECVRFRNRAANSLVVNSVIQWCGMLGLGVEPDQYKYHNAEGVYIGTSPKSTTQPMYQNDTSNNIVVTDSTINTFGSECFEVKENAHHNRMENVDCGYNDEPLAHQGSNVELRGDHNTVLRSRLYEQPQLEHEARLGHRGRTTSAATPRRAPTSARRRPRDRQPADRVRAVLQRHLHRPGQRGQQHRQPHRALRRGRPLAPTVTARTPAANATGVAVASNVTATFSEAVQPGQRHDVHAQGRFDHGVGAAVTYDAATRNATLDPTADLAANTQYTATLTGGASASGTRPAPRWPPVSWTFTTAAAGGHHRADRDGPDARPTNATGVAVGTT